MRFKQPRILLFDEASNLIQYQESHEILHPQISLSDDVLNKIPAQISLLSGELYIVSINRIV